MTEQASNPVSTTPFSREGRCKSILKRLGVLFLIFASLQALFLLCNLAATALPKEPIVAHLEESKDNPLLSRCFEYDHQLLGGSICYDNNRFIQAMAEEDTYGGDILKASVLSNVVYTFPGSDSQYVYYRYWHGWELLAFVCLTFGDINLFAVVLALITFLSSAFFINQLRHYLGWAPSLVFFFITFFATNIFINFIGDMLLSLSIFSLVAVCGLILKVGRCTPNKQLNNEEDIQDTGTLRENMPFRITCICFIGGCLFCYLDFFTIPSFAIGLTVFSCLIASGVQNTQLKKGLSLFLKFSITFLAGFVFTWAMKWVLAACFLGAAYVVKDVFGEVGMWAGENESVNPDGRLFKLCPQLYALYVSLRRVVIIIDAQNKMLLVGVACLLITFVLLIALFIYWVRRRRSVATQGWNGGLWALALTALYPPLYAMFAYSHTIWHLGIFGYKPWSFTFGCLSCIAVYLLLSGRKKHLASSVNETPSLCQDNPDPTPTTTNYTLNVNEKSGLINL